MVSYIISPVFSLGKQHCLFFQGQRRGNVMLPEYKPTGLELHKDLAFCSALSQGDYPLTLVMEGKLRTLEEPAEKSA